MFQNSILVEEDNGRQGIYECAACKEPLFEASKKFDAGCGFPSFWKHLGNAVHFNFLETYGRNRIQLLCAKCGQHLGHLFSNDVTPTQQRYCINHQSIKLVDPRLV